MLHGISLEPLPDEELSSILVRACREVGLSLHCFTHWYLDLPSGSGIHTSDNLLPVLARLTHTPAARVLLKHTLVPYATAFLSPDEAAPMHATLLDGTPPRALPWLGKIAPRWCAGCIEEDLRTFGTTYWHRTHSLPAVEICHLHDEPLMARRGTRPTTERANRALTFRGPRFLPGEREGESVRARAPASVRKALSIASAHALMTAGKPPSEPLSPQVLECVFGKSLIRHIDGYVNIPELLPHTNLLVLSHVAEQAIHASGGGVQLDLFSDKST